MSADWIPVGSLGVISSVVAWLVAWRVSAARSEGRSDAQHDAEDAKDTSVKQDIRDLRNEVRATMEELRTPGSRRPVKAIGIPGRGEQRYQQGAGKHHFENGPARRETCGSCEHSEAAYRGGDGPFEGDAAGSVPAELPFRAAGAAGIAA
jgi:hypothetical protein